MLHTWVNSKIKKNYVMVITYKTHSFSFRFKCLSSFHTSFKAFHHLKWWKALKDVLNELNTWNWTWFILHFLPKLNIFWGKVQCQLVQIYSTVKNIVNVHPCSPICNNASDMKCENFMSMSCENKEMEVYVIHSKSNPWNITWNLFLF